MCFISHVAFIIFGCILFLISPQVDSDSSEVLDHISQPVCVPAPLTPYYSLQVHITTHKSMKSQAKPDSSCGQCGLHSCAAWQEL